MSWPPEACVFLDDWRFFRLRTTGGSAFVCGREPAEYRASFRHSFVGNVLDGCRGGQGEDARRFCIRFGLPQWNPWRFCIRFGLPRRTTGGFSFVLDWLAKSLAEVRVFSKWLAENGGLSDCFPPFFVREIAIHLRLYVKSPFIGGGLTPPGGAHRLHELPQRGGRTHVC